MKGGSTGEDLYRVFMTGLNGTPMPSFVDTIKPDEAWDLVHYMQSLGPKKPATREDGRESIDEGVGTWVHGSRRPRSR